MPQKSKKQIFKNKSLTRFKVCSPIEEYQEAAAYTLYPVDTPENSVMWESWADKSNNPSKVRPKLITNPKKVHAGGIYSVVIDLCSRIGHDLFCYLGCLAHKLHMVN